MLEQAQPTGFDPVQVFSSTSMPVTYSALYGQFLVPDPDTGVYECGLCESFTTEDGGATWEVVTREGLTFTDGTAFDAEAIKYNWDRIKDPANGSASAGIASQIDHIEIVDERTAKIVMVVPNPGFMGLMPIYALQWIASPTALEKGTEEFNKNPIGAGPFVFDSWIPNGVVKLTKNPDYYDAPRPYLDALEIQGVPDNAQRLNALISGGADLIMNSDASIFAEGTAAGFIETNYTFNGGIGFMLNTSKPPFDDIRARNALAYALDLEQLSDAVTKGYPSVPETLFTEDSPFYADIPLQTHDAKKAQKLFDELAAEGTPVEFAYTVFPGPGQTVFDALQAQLSTYENVTVTADQRDTSEQGVVGTTGDYQALTSSLAFSDPASRLWATLHGDAERTNYSRIDDPELNEALDAAVAATDVEEQKKHWATVQELLAELDPYILYQQFFNGTLSTDKVNGIVMYGYTTPAAANLWLQQ
ncbi:ABC transporter substrate-binding protein [Microbacterium sp. SS28]|uniref:ABC transporter substrate-binding protein n=1 Tax=Microbacterium sp. SS28 TaxID=2919948 RepID=UPI001FAAD94A|nr:ABC transporter substrate-binding protein [Microbacterium sp. SS28]